MKVIYDISVLGAGMYQNRARTGVSRVIQSLSEALVQHPGVDLSFSACWSVTRHVQARRFIEDATKFSQIELLRSANSGCASLADAVNVAYPAPGLNRWKQQAFTVALFPVDKLFCNIQPRQNQAGSIFHSTFYPLPRASVEEMQMSRVLTIYDLIPVLHPEYFKPAAPRLMRKVLASIRETDRLVAISKATKADLCEFTGIEEERVTVTHPAASDLFYPENSSQRRAEVCAKYNLPKLPYVLSVCTLEPRKNVIHTIRSFEKLIHQQSIRDLDLVLVGSKGWNLDNMFSESGIAKSLRNHITFTGYVPDHDLAALYSGAMMFVYPSLYEGFGLPPLEAMQCGVPVITSNNSSLPEVVGDAGIMVNATDGDALCQAMFDLYRDSSKRAQLSALGIARAKQFSWKKCADQTVEAYQAALDSQS